MNIEVLKAYGEGPNPLSAFHRALDSIGLSDLNLITLSSVIPANTTIIEKNKTTLKFKRGDRIYVVLSHIEGIKGENIYAGLGWYQREDGSGYFVEHHGNSSSIVINDIKESLKDMLTLNNENYKINYSVIGKQVNGSYGSALVVATYKIESW